MPYVVTFEFRDQVFKLFQMKSKSGRNSSPLLGALEEGEISGENSEQQADGVIDEEPSSSHTYVLLLYDSLRIFFFFLVCLFHSMSFLF